MTTRYLPHGMPINVQLYPLAYGAGLCAMVATMDAALLPTGVKAGSPRRDTFGQSKSWEAPG